MISMVATPPPTLLPHRSLERDVEVLALGTAAEYPVHAPLGPLVHDDPWSVALLRHGQVPAARVYLRGYERYGRQCW